MTEKGSAPRIEATPFLAMGALFIIVDLVSLLLVGPFGNVGLYAFENPSDPVDVVYFGVMMLISTGVILLLRKYRRGELVKWVLRGTIGVSLFSTFYSLSWPSWGDPLASLFSVMLSGLCIGVLVKWPKWYVIDAAALFLGSVTTAVLGISLAAPLVAALLLVLAVYDAISVYKTKHMLSLAEVILNSGLPLVLIIPKKGEYKEGQRVEILKENPSGKGDRPAFYMGLGDLVVPSCLVVSLYSRLGVAGYPVIIAVLVGTLIGFSVLSIYVARGKPQAGLPFLCSGAVLGYIISSYLMYGALVG